MGTIPLLQTVGALAADRSPSPVYQPAAQRSVRNGFRAMGGSSNGQVKLTSKGVVWGNTGPRVGLVRPRGMAQPSRTRTRGHEPRHSWQHTQTGQCAL